MKSLKEDKTALTQIQVAGPGALAAALALHLGHASIAKQRSVQFVQPPPGGVWVDTRLDRR